jgi:hypothetical protein
MRWTYPVLTLALAACQAPLPEDDPNACGKDRYSHLIGASKDRVQAAALPEDTRIYGPNDAVTLELRPERLNFVLDAEDKVIMVVCG